MGQYVRIECTHAVTDIFMVLHMHIQLHDITVCLRFVARVSTSSLCSMNDP